MAELSYCFVLLLVTFSMGHNHLGSPLGCNMLKSLA
jgi:hypothetical protein